MNDDQQLAVGDVVNLSPEYEAWYREEWPKAGFIGETSESWNVFFISDDELVTLTQHGAVRTQVPRRFVSKQ